jgi:serine/threonine-protein kinase
MFNPNPFTNRNAIIDVNDFYGRTEDLRDLYQRILQGMCVSLIGERRVGKSSLLNALRFERDIYDISPDVKFVLLDLQDLADWDESAIIGRLLTLIEDETGVAAAGRGRQDLSATIARVAGSKQRLAILIDEFNFLTENNNISPGFFSNLRAINATHRVPFVVAYREGTVRDLVAGLNESAGLSPFMNVFGTKYIGPFSAEDARELITKPAEESGLPFTDAEAERIQRLAGRLPFFLQIACYHAFEAKRKGPIASYWSEIEAGFRLEVEHHFVYQWNRLSPEERAVLRQRRSPKPTKASPAEQRAVSLLHQKGILIADGSTERVFSPLFEELIDAPAGAVEGVRP